MEAAAAGDSLIGFVLEDKFRVIRQIGRGGMGIVYEAEHVGLGKRVAIKLMLEKYAQDGEARARFQREARAAGRIGNPHIIDISDVGIAPDGRGYVVMELLHGVSLKDVIAHGPLSPWRAIHIIKQVLRAVAAAHQKGIIHRDLKPDNIFLLDQGDQGDFVKLLDFGISKIVDPDDAYAATRLTTTGVVMGTPLYMAPEQALGNPADRPADIYACGVILYEMLAGVPPFDGTTYAAVIGKLLTALPPPLAQLRPGLPLALVGAVHKALEKEPENRFRSAEQFGASLPGDRTASEIELAGTLDSGMAIAVAPALTIRKRGRLPLVLGALVLVAVVGGGTAALVATRGGKNATASVEPSGTPAPAPAPPRPDKPDKPEADTGQLEVKTTPPGASITIDGKFAGNAPLDIALAPGPHRVRVELEGHEPMELEQTLARGERTAMVVPLAKVATPDAPKPDKPVAPTITHLPIAKSSKDKPTAKVDPPKQSEPNTGQAEPAKIEPKSEPAKANPVKTGPHTTVGTKPNPY